MPVISYILISVIGVSLLSLIGVFSLAIKEAFLKKMLILMVSFAAGTLLAAAFLDILPEALAGTAKSGIYFSILLGIISFFVMEKFLYWYHCHEINCEVHSFTYLNLFGGSIHNFIDGVIIASSFLSSTQLGIITTLAIACHEIPRELGDFCILVYGGFSRSKALLYNFFSALVAVLGAVSAYFFSTQIQGATYYILGFAGGSFIYISCADLIPELHKERGIKLSVLQFALLICGASVIAAAKAIFK